MIKKWFAVLFLVLLPLVGFAAYPKGIQNNNPGNIVATSIKWKGEVACDGRFECFRSPEMGIRALARNLHTYITKYKLYTVDGIIHRWAPSHENNTRVYVKYIRDNLTLTGNIQEDIYQLTKLIILYENGINPYADSMVKDIVYDTIRNDNYAYLDYHRGLAKNSGNEATDIPDAAGSPDRTLQARAQREERDTKGKGQGSPVDTPFYRFNIGNIYHSPTFVDGCIITEYSYNARLDGIQPRVPIYRRERIDGLALRNWSCPDPTPHPLSKRDYWVLFRRELGWT